MITEYKFTDEEIKLLKKDLPETPCVECDKFLCFGCRKIDKYDEKMKPYIESGIIKFANIIKKIRQNNHQMFKIHLQNEELIRELPQDIRHLVNSNYTIYK